MNHDNARTSLPAYRDGELDENLTYLVSQHLEECAACREELRQIDRIDSLVRGLPSISAAEGFAVEVIARSRAEKARRRKTILPRALLDGLSLVADSFFELLAGYGAREKSLDEFGDFPPLSLGHAYLRLIGGEE